MVGRAHKKQLEKLQKIKSFSADLVRKYKDDFSSVGDVVCHCSRHKQGCGCLSKAFIKKARNSFRLFCRRVNLPKSLQPG